MCRVSAQCLQKAPLDEDSEQLAIFDMNHPCKHDCTDYPLHQANRVVGWLHNAALRLKPQASERRRSLQAQELAQLLGRDLLSELPRRLAIRQDLANGISRDEGICAERAVLGGAVRDPILFLVGEHAWAACLVLCQPPVSESMQVCLGGVPWWVCSA